METMHRMIRMTVACTSLLMVCVSAAAGVDTSRVTSTVLKAVVKVTAFSSTGAPVALGTGFLVSRATSPDEQSDRRYYLVTNKHMLGDWTLFNGTIVNYFPSIEATFYGETSAQPAMRVPLSVVDNQGKLHRNVQLHHGATVDVAAIALTPNSLPLSPRSQISFDPSYMLAFDKITTYLTGLGDQVFALGYPRGVTSLTTSYPIAKAGYLATEPGQPFAIDLTGKDRSGNAVKRRLEGKILLVDGLLVPGNSGGPVVLPADLKVRRDPSTNQLQFATEQLKNYVIGIVSGNLDGSGLTLVYSVDYICEVIDALENEGGHRQEINERIGGRLRRPVRPHGSLCLTAFGGLTRIFQ